jgi:uncharacterized protein (TIGR03437 family)
VLTSATLSKGEFMKKFSSCFLPSVSILLSSVSASAALQAPVALGSDSTFVALANTTVTVTGGGTITGNIGISPGNAFVPGTPPVFVKGIIYAGGAVAAQAQADLTTAFNDAASRQTPVIVAGNVGGQTLTPGLYKSTSSLAISSGDLTLDAQGDPNAVFIFQIASTLTTTSGRLVILAGGANAANIFWQVGSSATIGTTSVFHGTIMASASISVLTGATLDGRALAQNGAVTVDTGGASNVSAPAAPVSTAPVIFPAGTTNNSTGTVNEASFAAPVVAGSIVAVFGTNLSAGQSNSALPTPLPMSLDQSSVVIGSWAAPYYFASPGQINVQIPWELAGQTGAAITATVAGVPSNIQAVRLVAFAPGIFSMNLSGSGQGAILISDTAQLAAPGTPVLRGKYISIYCTGLGPVTNQPATGAPAPSSPLSYSVNVPAVTIGGVAAGVTYSGLAPTLVGLYQVNAQVPAGVTPGDAVQVVMSLGGIPSNTVTIAVQ